MNLLYISFLLFFIFCIFMYQMYKKMLEKQDDEKMKKETEHFQNQLQPVRNKKIVYQMTENDVFEILTNDERFILKKI